MKAIYHINLGNHTFGDWLGLILIIFIAIIAIKKYIPKLDKLFEPAAPTPFEIERGKIEKALQYINKWNDMPTSWLLPEFCDIMQIEPNNAAKSLLTEMCMPNFDADKCANRILKLRNIQNQKQCTQKTTSQPTS